jgi:hypothetical protein
MTNHIWLTNLEQVSTNLPRLHQDPGFWLEQHQFDLDINRLKCLSIMQIKQYMRGDATRMDTYIKLGQLDREFNSETGMFYRKWPAHHEVEAMHEAFYNLPYGYHRYHEIDPLPHPDKYRDQIGEFWPPGLDEIMLKQRIMAPRAQGPPDWVSAPEGISYTCEDVTITMRTRLPIPEGCLNSDM